MTERTTLSTCGAHQDQGHKRHALDGMHETVQPMLGTLTVTDAGGHKGTPGPCVPPTLEWVGDCNVAHHCNGPGARKGELDVSVRIREPMRSTRAVAGQGGGFHACHRQAPQAAKWRGHPCCCRGRTPSGTGRGRPGHDGSQSSMGPGRWPAESYGAWQQGQRWVVAARVADTGQGWPTDQHAQEEH